ncbi:hypothetical protein EVAR_94746_1 [Eumeta japonica]|uniref:Uncharacterized protein n=1 Tax=Eumeta variegata TaxID=151549 RepID=A0A4C1UVV0_EUMVA|nr:hypothetical protein EVAR_94746_1 [Eumeta japonica]
MEELLVEIRKGIQSKNIQTGNVHETNVSEDVDMKDIDKNKEISTKTSTEEEIPFSYLYRTSKANRVFVPHSVEGESEQRKKFTGQEFVEVTNKVEDLFEGNFYKKMYIKRVTNNPNRPKRDKNQKT